MFDTLYIFSLINIFEQLIKLLSLLSRGNIVHSLNYYLHGEHSLRNFAIPDISVLALTRIKRKYLPTQLCKRELLLFFAYKKRFLPLCI